MFFTLFPKPKWAGCVDDTASCGLSTSKLLSLQYSKSGVRTSLYPYKYFLTWIYSNLTRTLGSQHYGREIVAKELGLSEEHPDVQRVFVAVYKSFVEVSSSLRISLLVIHSQSVENGELVRLGLYIPVLSELECSQLVTAMPDKVKQCVPVSTLPQLSYLLYQYRCLLDWYAWSSTCLHNLIFILFFGHWNELPAYGTSFPCSAHEAYCTASCILQLPLNLFRSKEVIRAHTIKSCISDNSCHWLLQGIDGIDNGVNQYDTDKPPRYVNDTHLSARVGRLNPDWMDEQTTDNENKAFHRAMSLTGGEFLEVY